MSIEAIRSALPRICQDAKELARQTKADEEFIRQKIGIQTRYILGPEETGVSLATAASRKLFGDTGLHPHEVGLLVFVTQNPDRRIPHNAPALAEALGIPHQCASFDISLGCSGYVYGLSIAEAFLEAHEIENGLLVTCDPYSRIMLRDDKATNAVFGDAATATWLTRERRRTKLRGLDFGTDGALADAIRVNAGGAAAPYPLTVPADRSEAAGDPAALHLQMNGREVFNFVNAVIPNSVERSLEKAKLHLDDVDWFALHQGSEYMLRSLAKRAGIPTEKLLINIGKYGNTVSSSVPLLLEEVMRDEDLAGRFVMISGFGVGASWATGILEFVRGEQGNYERR